MTAHFEFALRRRTTVEPKPNATARCRFPYASPVSRLTNQCRAIRTWLARLAAAPVLGRLTRVRARTYEPRADRASENGFNKSPAKRSARQELGQAEVAEWQTRRTQNPVPARGCGFKSHLRHSSNNENPIGRIQESRASQDQCEVIRGTVAGTACDTFGTTVHALSFALGQEGLFRCGPDNA